MSYIIEDFKEENNTNKEKEIKKRKEGKEIIKTSNVFCLKKIINTTLIVESIIIISLLAFILLDDEFMLNEFKYSNPISKIKRIIFKSKTKYFCCPIINNHSYEINLNSIYLNDKNITKVIVSKYNIVVLILNIASKYLIYIMIKSGIILLMENIILLKEKKEGKKIRKDIITGEKIKIRNNEINDIKRNNDKIYNRIKFRKHKSTINMLIIIDLFIINFHSYKVNNLFESNNANITLKIKGTGNKNLFGQEDPTHTFTKNMFPDEIIINGIIQENKEYEYNFNQTENIVELKWKRLINTCRNMFRGCRDIIEFDFSNFNTSGVEDMAFMFMYCSSLTSLNITNFDTSKVTDTGYTFHDCSSLTSLDLSNFDTSKVSYMGFMFQHWILKLQKQ